MIKYKRNLPKGGPSSLVLSLGVGAMSVFGMYKVVQANRLRRKWAREEADIRMAVLPFLDTEYCLQMDYLKEKQTAKEQEIMADIGGWEAGASVYKSRYMRPMEVIGVQKHSLFE